MTRASGFKLRSLVICEDARREDNGKELLIGVFSGVIATKRFPVTLPKLVIRIEAMSDVANISGPTAVRILGPNKREVMRAEGNLGPNSVVGPDTPFSLSLTWGPATFVAPGTYVVRFRILDVDHRAGDFRVRLVEGAAARDSAPG